MGRIIIPKGSRKYHMLLALAHRGRGGESRDGRVAPNTRKHVVHLHCTASRSRFHAWIPCFFRPFDRRPCLVAAWHGDGDGDARYCFAWPPLISRIEIVTPSIKSSVHHILCFIPSSFFSSPQKYILIFFIKKKGAAARPCYGER